MTKTLTKHGNSYALIIEKAILDLLNIGPDTQLNITTDGKSLTIRPADTDGDKKFQTALDQACDQYRQSFGDLAK